MAKKSSNPTKHPVVTAPKMKIDKDSVSRYANNVQFDSNIWGMRLQFGEIETEGGTMVINQHTTITIPWLLAKILMGYIWANVSGHEAEFGEIQVPARFLPAAPETTALGGRDK